MRLEELVTGAVVRGLVHSRLATVTACKWYGDDVVELTYRNADGNVASALLYRDDEARLQPVTEGRPWAFDGDGATFRLVSEAHRIRLAHLFDPLLAVHTSLVDPLPHQLTAVYERMLPVQPLRFL
ncbi:MAG: RNA helicase, partial [Chloroflexi bacterium]|nr:RNA helicase [Chloroflexota bacterium]